MAPHPDDETFACGGLIRLKRDAGVTVRVVLLTDGEAVGSGLGETREAIVAARRREACNACHRLGLETGEMEWLHLPDSLLPHEGHPGFEEAACAVLAQLEEFAPEEIYCPHPQDPHCDHAAAAQLVRRALQLWPGRCTLFHYPVWMWYHARRGSDARPSKRGAWRLDIAAAHHSKVQAMSAYLDAPKTSQGQPYCGRLPWSLLRNFRRRSETYFEAPEVPKEDTALHALFGPPCDTMSPPLKALFVNPGGAVAYGSERSMVNLLRTKTFHAEVVCAEGGALERELHEIGVKLIPLEFGKYSLRQNPFWHAGFYRRLRRILMASKPDFLVINLDGNTPLVTLAAVRLGIPLLRFSRFEFKPPTRWLERWCWLQAAAIICPSELVRRQVVDWLPTTHKSRAHCFYEVFGGRVATRQEIQAFRRKFGLGYDRIIGYVGRLHRGKRIETAIEALAAVRKGVTDARLLIVGGDSSPDESAYKSELQQLARVLGVEDAVAFTGYRDAGEIPAAVGSLDVCILPSESESFGMVLMEAWAQGVPTVASDVGGCSEITRASGGGHLAAVGDVKSFARHLLGLLTDPRNAAAMGRRGKAWVAQNCSASDYAARFGSLLEPHATEAR